MIIFAAAAAIIAGCYQLVALAACVLHIRKPPPIPGEETGVSVLKPVHGLHPGFEEALRSHAEQDYSKFELLLGYSQWDEPALRVINRVIDKYPNVAIRAVLCGNKPAANGKVGVLAQLQAYARYPALIVNDADITVPPGYLREVTAPLSDPRTGLVTCIYRAEAESWPGRWEALGVATDFAPSALVASLVGVSEFGMGATLAFRRTDLEQMGGFAAIADYLADDYQLGAKIHALGRQNQIARCIVCTRLHELYWSGVWRHQVRWARTVRLSRPNGYLGMPVTFASLWAALAAAAGIWWLAAGLLALRLAMAITAGWFLLRSTDVLRLWYLIPLRDLYAVAVWIAGLSGSSVEWGEKILHLDGAGRIVSSDSRRNG